MALSNEHFVSKTILSNSFSVSDFLVVFSFLFPEYTVINVEGTWVFGEKEKAIHLT